MSGKHTLIDLTPSAAIAAREVALRYGNKPDALLEILHDLQEELGFIPEAALPALAKALNLSRAEVHGVVTFYHDYRRAPAGRHVIKVCRAEACQARAVEYLVTPAEAAAGERVKLSTVYCLGLCSVGPNARVGDTLHARLDEAALVALVRSA